MVAGAIVHRNSSEDGLSGSKMSRPADGLVSRYVQMWERDSSTPPKPYRHRPQDSFQSNDRTFYEESDLPDESRHEDVYYDEPKESSEDRHETSTPPVPPTINVCHTDVVASSLVETGIQHYDSGEYESALSSFASALKTQRVTVGDSDISVALSLGNIGATYLQMGKFHEAEASLKEAMAMKLGIAPDASVADILNNLGNCLCHRMEYNDSILYYEAALNDLKEHNGSEVDLANTYFNIARVAVTQKEWELAFFHLAEADKYARNVYGDDHDLVAQIMDLVGYVHMAQGDFENALVGFTNALTIHRRLKGPMNFDVANSLVNVGILRESKGELNEAWEAYTTAFDLFVSLKVQPDHPGFQIVQSSISIVERAVAKRSQAKLVEKHRHAKEVAQFQSRAQAVSEVHDEESDLIGSV